MDIFTINKTGANYELTLMLKVDEDQSKFTKKKVNTNYAKLIKRCMGPKKIPFIVTSNGRTLRYPNPNITEHDTVKHNLETNEIVDYYKYKLGA